MRAPKAVTLTGTALAGTGQQPPAIAGILYIGTGAIAPVYTTGTIGSPVGISSGSDPIDAVFAPDGLTAYVVSAGGDAVQPVSVVRDTTLAVRPFIPTRPDPVAAAVTPGSKTVLVADNFGIKVSGHWQYWVHWISAATGKVTAHARVGAGPISLAITPNGKDAFVTSPDAGTVTELSVARHKAIHTIHPGGFDPEAIAITRNGKYAYVADNGSGKITPIRISDHKALAPIKVGSFPAAIAITPNDRDAYVTSNGSGTVSEISLATRKVIRTIRTGGYPEAIAILPDAAYAYVASFDNQAIRKRIDTVYAIRLSSGAVKDIRTGRGPISLGVLPGGADVYSANFWGNSVSTIATAGNTVIRTTTTPPYTGPAGFAMRS